MLCFVHTGWHLWGSGLVATAAWHTFCSPVSLQFIPPLLLGCFWFPESFNGAPKCLKTGSFLLFKYKVKARYLIWHRWIDCFVQPLHFIQFTFISQYCQFPFHCFFSCARYTSQVALMCVSMTCRTYELECIYRF